MKTSKLFAFIFLCIGLCNGYGQAQDCATAVAVCTDANSEGVVNGFGIDDFYGATNSGCLERGGANAAYIEENSYWFKIKMAADGEFGFNIIPNDLTEDWDFAVYGPNPTCGALSSPVKCNYRGAAGMTGVGVDPNTGTQTTAYDSWLNVSAGDEYLILVNQYDGNNAGFSINFVGEIFTTAPQVLDCSILVDLGLPRNVCEGEITYLNAKTFGDNSYAWYVRNAFGTYDLIPNETGEILIVNASGNYKVEVTDNTTGTLLGESDVDVTYFTNPVAGIPDPLAVCDTDGDGEGDFDLTLRSDDILAGQTGMSVSYYDNENYALAAVAPIGNSYSGTDTTVWARLENDASTNCYDVVPLNLLVVGQPVAAVPPDIIECDNNNDGKFIFNLEAQTPYVLNGQVGVVTYYTDEFNAHEPKGWLGDPLAYESGSRTIWARYEPTFRSECYDVVSFEIVVLDSPVAFIPGDIKICDTDNDGFNSFNFNELKDAEILGGLDPATYEIHYFSTQFDADSNSNELPVPYVNVTAYAVQNIFARIQNVGSSKCYDTTSFTIQVFDTSFAPPPGEIPDLSYCDDISDGDDTNGFYQFDLTERESSILNGQSPFVFDISYFSDPTYQNQIPNPSAFTNNFKDRQTIYVRVQNNNPNNTDVCFTDTSFDVEVRPLPRTLLEPFDFYQCDDDGDGITIFNLSEAEPFLTLGNNALIVTFHESLGDASSGVVPINKFSYSNANFSKVFARLRSNIGCYRIVEVNLVVSTTSFPPGYLHQMMACDNDGNNDGFYEFNLTQATSEFISNFFPVQNLRVNFYRNQTDALAETNAIDPAIAYVNETAYSQFLWVRIESADTGGCFGVGEVMELIVNNIPEFELDEEAVLCLNNLPLTVSTYNPDDVYTYEWYDEGANFVGEGPFLDIYQAGIYNVFATSLSGCDSFPRQITVTESSIADIGIEDISIAEEGHSFSLTINNANQNLGIGDYEFALDDIDGSYQDDNVFYNVPPGIRTVYVREKNGCGIAMVDVYVLGFPSFFTPNNDGINDFWNVRGVDFSNFPQSVLHVFDRYGKHLATFGASQPGWDGLYNGSQAMSSDYWFTAELVDLNGQVSQYKGHFSLIRR